MADSDYTYYDSDTGQTVSYDPLPDNTFDWNDWGGNPADYGGSTNDYIPTDTSGGMDYSGSGGSNASGGAGTYNTNFGFEATAKPTSVTDIVQKAAGSFDLGSLASGALDWLMAGNNWSKVLAGAGGLAAFLQANGAKEKSAGESAAEQYKAMYDILHKPVKINGQMVDLYGPINNIKPIDRMRTDATGTFIPPPAAPTTPVKAAMHGGLIHNYANGGLVQNYATGGTVKLTTAQKTANLENLKDQITPGMTQAAVTALYRTVPASSLPSGASTALLNTAKTVNLNSLSDNVVAGTNVKSLVKDSGLLLPSDAVTKLTEIVKPLNLESLTTQVAAGTNVKNLANTVGTANLPKDAITKLTNLVKEANYTQALTEITSASTPAEIDAVIKKYGAANLPANIKTSLLSDLNSDRTTGISTMDNRAELLSKITATMTDDELQTLIASYGGALPADAAAKATETLANAKSRETLLQSQGTSSSTFKDVGTLYKTFLGRDPTEDEKKYWGSQLLLDGVISISEVEKFKNASAGESAYTASQAGTAAKSAYTATDVANAAAAYFKDPNSLSADNKAIIQAVGGIENANAVANNVYSGTLKGTTVISSNQVLPTGYTLYTDPKTGLTGYKDAKGNITYAPGVKEYAAITPANAWELLAKEQTGAVIPESEFAKYGGRENVLAAAKNYTGAHVGLTTTYQMERYNPTNYAVKVTKNDDGSYTTLYADGKSALGVPTGYEIPAETTTSTGTGTNTEAGATAAIPRSQNLYTGDFARYGRPGAGGEHQFFNISNPLVNVPGGIYDPSITGANQPKDVWTGLTPTTPATPTPSTGTFAQNVARGTQYIPPAATTTPATTPAATSASLGFMPWNYVPPAATTTPTTATTQAFANGGAAWASARNTVPGTEFSYARGGKILPPERPRMNGHINGDGHGQEDLIAAQLSDGEYVIDADVVAALGNGSTKAGAAALDQMREAIRKDNRAAPINKIPSKAKHPLEYIKKTTRGRK